MAGNAWKYSGVLDDYDLAFLQRDFITIKQGVEYYGFSERPFIRMAKEADFNYTLPRTSYEQRSAGRGVSYSEAQPGDLICYDGHVAMYIGGGMIVHASTQRTGIKIGNAQYRTILAVRRIV